MTTADFSDVPDPTQSALLLAAWCQIDDGGLDEARALLEAVLVLAADGSPGAERAHELLTWCVSDDTDEEPWPLGGGLDDYSDDADALASVYGPSDW